MHSINVQRAPQNGHQGINSNGGRAREIKRALYNVVKHNTRNEGREAGVAPAPSPFPSPLVYRPLFPAKVRCVCARPSFGLNEVSAKQWVQQTRSSCRRMQNPGLSQFEKGAGGAATAVRTARSVPLLGVQCGEVPPSRASGDLEGQRWGCPTPLLWPATAVECPAGPASGFLGGPQWPPGAHPVCGGCHRPGPHGGLELGPQSRSSSKLGGGRP